MADLVVELYGTPAGVLRGTWRSFDFLPDPAAVARFGIDSAILSVAIPLTAVAVRSRKERRQNFFRELLPEGRMLSRLSQQAGVAEQDVIGLLRAYDVVPQAHLPNDGEVALAVGGEYRHAAITMSQLVAEGDAWGLAATAALAEETANAVLQLARNETPHDRAHSALVPDIVAFTENLLAGRPVGPSVARRDLT